MKFTMLCKRYVCMSLIVILMLSGICLIEKQTYSSFSCEDFQNSSIYITSVSTLTSQDICTNEVIGIRSDSSKVTRNASRSEKKENRVHTIIVSILAVPLEISQHFLKSYDGYNQTISQTLSVIICYIYNQGASKG